MHRLHRPTVTSVLVLAATLLLYAGPAEGHVKLLVPNGGEMLKPGDVVTIKWRIEIRHTLLYWDLWYRTGPNERWLTIAMSLPPGDPAPGSIHTYEWTIPDTPTSEARVRVKMDNSGQDYYDVSDGDFTIEGVVACELVKKLKVKCRKGKLKATLLSDLPKGTVLNLTRNGGNAKEVTVNKKGKAKTKWKKQSGKQEVCLDECQDVCANTNCR